MEVLSKQEVAQNVLDYYVRHKEKLRRSLESCPTGPDRRPESWPDRLI